jgi:hypothetical protein
MSTLSQYVNTLSEWSKRQDPEGGVAKIAELLSETNQILADAQFVEGNLPTGHRTTVRTDLPTVTWRKLNYGVQPSKSKTAQITDSCGMLEAYSEVDKSLADLNGNTQDFRISEDRAFLEAMNQEFANTFIYGDTASDPEKFLGLASRYDDASMTNVVDFGDAGNACTSIWIVTWSPNTVHFFFPKGSKAGLQHTDKGQVTLEDSQSPSGKFEGYRSHYKWDVGLCVRDWRYVVRIASIDTQDFSNDALRQALVQGINLLPNPDMGNTVIYMNKTVKTALDIEAMEKANLALSVEDWDGRPLTKFWGFPVRRVDQILNTEAAL